MRWKEHPTRHFAIPECRVAYAVPACFGKPGNLRDIHISFAVYNAGLCRGGASARHNAAYYQQKDTNNRYNLFINSPNYPFCSRSLSAQFGLYANMKFEIASLEGCVDRILVMLPPS